MPEENGGGQPDLAGYQSVEDLVKAYRSSGEEAKRLKTVAEHEQRQRQMLEQQIRQQPVHNGNQGPSARLAEMGIPVDALDELFADRFAKAFEPLARGAMARNTMLSEHPDYTKYEADVAKFVEADPELSNRYQRMFSSDPVGAMEYALLKYGETRRKETPSQKNPQEGARREAQIPSSRSGDARNQAPQEDQAVARGWEHFQKTGDPRTFAKARLRQVISDDFLNRG